MCIKKGGVKVKRYLSLFKKYYVILAELRINAKKPEIDLRQRHALA
jgi:hypothetical protein